MIIVFSLKSQLLLNRDTNNCILCILGRQVNISSWILATKNMTNLHVLKLCLPGLSSVYKQFHTCAQNHSPDGTTRHWKCCHLGNSADIFILFFLTMFVDKFILEFFLVFLVFNFASIKVCVYFTYAKFAKLILANNLYFYSNKWLRNLLKYGN